MYALKQPEGSLVTSGDSQSSPIDFAAYDPVLRMLGLELFPDQEVADLPDLTIDTVSEIDFEALFFDNPVLAVAAPTVETVAAPAVQVDAPRNENNGTPSAGPSISPLLKKFKSNNNNNKKR